MKPVYSRRVVVSPAAAADIMQTMPDGWMHTFARSLLGWYRRAHRKLPWRAEPGSLPPAYHTLVSEAMLQQTQVATVLGYFERFLRTFPTIGDLAHAEEQAVLRAWQGLGYYRRARHLHAAAKAIVTEHGGQIPETAEALRKLPGVGPYTAGAIASIALGKPEPVVDGNVARVFGRWLAMDDAVDSTAGKKQLWAVCGKLVAVAADERDSTAGDFNQAIMELGARICTPGKPNCGTCPVAEGCRARKRDAVGQYPVTLPRRKPATVTHHVIALRRGNRYLFHRRGNDGLWAGMWQMPTVDQLGGDLPGLVPWLKDTTGLTCRLGDEVARFTHVTTHRRIQFRVIAGTWMAGRLKPGAGVWRRLTALDDLPLSKAQQRAVALVIRAAEENSAREATSAVT